MPSVIGEENAQVLVREVGRESVSTGNSVVDGKCFATVESGVTGNLYPIRASVTPTRTPVLIVGRNEWL